MFHAKRFGCYRKSVNSVLNTGDVIEVTTERLAYGGDAVARHNGLAVFVPLAAPGERLRIRISERKKNFARGVIEQITDPSPARREPRCRYFGECGGCHLQHINYESQLEAKVGFVRDALERIARINWPHPIEIRHAAEFGYRGRAQVKIDWKTRRVGFRRAASNAVCDVESCAILVPELDEALGGLRNEIETAGAENQLLAESEVEMAAGESGVAFAPSSARFPETALQRVVRDVVYKFGPSTFFQVNPSLLDALVGEAIDESTGDLALDLFAGVGLFTIQLARRFKRVVGVESDEPTANFAFQNIKENGYTNIEFHNASVEAWLASSGALPTRNADLVLLDPPRAGAADSMTKIVELKPGRIVYVSCDPTTLARDLRLLVDSGYEPSSITAVDLFPQTYHVETVVRLERR